MQHEELRELLEYLHDKYNRAEFIEPDPISIPHSPTATTARFLDFWLPPSPGVIVKP